MYTLLIVLVLDGVGMNPPIAITSEVIHGFETLESCETQAQVQKKSLGKYLRKFSEFRCFEVQ